MSLRTPERSTTIADQFNRWAARSDSSPPAPWRWPIGGPGDRSAAALLDAVRFGDAALREAVSGAVDASGADGLVTIALRLAALGGRRRSCTDVERAALALALAVRGIEEERTILMAIAIPGHSARLIGIDPAELYRDVATWSPTIGADALIRHAPKVTTPLDREPGRKTGAYTEGVGIDGDFAYQPAPPLAPDPLVIAATINRLGTGWRDQTIEAHVAVPDPAAHTFATLLETANRLTPVARGTAAAALDPGGRYGLATFARLCAAQGERDRNPTLVELAFRALGFAVADAPDDAEVGATVGFPRQAAARLGLNADRMASESAAWLPASGGSALLRWASDWSDPSGTGSEAGNDGRER